MTSRLQSDVFRMDHVVQQFGQGLFQDDLTQAVIGTVPFALVDAGIWGLVVFCLRYKRARKNVVKSQSQFGARFRYNLASSGVRYLIPFGIATAFWVLLSCYINLFGGSLPRHSLMSMQQFFECVSTSFRHYLKWPEYTIPASLVAIYVLSCVLLSKQLPEGNEEGVTAGAGDRLQLREFLVATLYRVVACYKYYGPVNILLATLASFTLFGVQLGATAKDLQLQLNHGQVEYSKVTKRTEVKLSEVVAAKLFEEIRDAFPDYKEELKLRAQIDSEVESIQQHADNAKSRDPVVERTLQDEQARIKKVNEFRSDLRIEGTGRQSVPENATYNQIEDLRKALDSRPERKGIELIREGRKKITLEVGTLASEPIRILTRPLIERYPILESPIEALADAVNKTSQQSIEMSYDRVIETAMKNPQDIETVVEHESKAIVDKTDIHTLVERAAPRAQQQSEKLKQELSSLQEIKRRIDHDVAEIRSLPDPRPPRGSPDQIAPPGSLDPPKKAYPETLDQLLTDLNKVSEYIGKLLRTLEKSHPPR